MLLHAVTGKIICVPSEESNVEVKYINRYEKVTVTIYTLRNTPFCKLRIKGHWTWLAWFNMHSLASEGTARPPGNVSVCSQYTSCLPHHQESVISEYGEYSSKEQAIRFTFHL